jgi:hypothetical protein
MAQWSIPRAEPTNQVRPCDRNGDNCCSNSVRAVSRSTSREPVIIIELLLVIVAKQKELRTTILQVSWLLLQFAIIARLARGHRHQ